MGHDQPLFAGGVAEGDACEAGDENELVAAEPLVVIRWRRLGAGWPAVVVEMRDYPSGITWNKEGDEFR